MKPGNKILFYFILFLFSPYFSFAEDKIISAPLINLDKLKPSFEELNENKENLTTSKDLKEKKKLNNSLKSPHAVLIGLDKITAKSSQLTINLEEIKKFGPLEIKILKCGKVKVNNKMVVL